MMESSSMEIRYADPYSVFLVNHRGQLRQLFTPFRAVCIHAIGRWPAGTTIYVNGVWKHPEFRLVYLVYGRFYPYYCFRLHLLF